MAQRVRRFLCPEYPSFFVSHLDHPAYRRVVYRLATSPRSQPDKHETAALWMYCQPLAQGDFGSFIQHHEIISGLLALAMHFDDHPPRLRPQMIKAQPPHFDDP